MSLVKVYLMKKAIFLDRDGVINKEKEYLYKIEDFEFIEGCFESLLKLQERGYFLFIITNQSGIGRNYYSEDDFKKLTSWMINEFKKRGITISQVEYCKHIKNDMCNCRKPKTGMIENILKNYSIDLNKSWLVGDKHSDIQCALNAGIKNTIQVRSGHKFSEKETKANYVCNTIADLSDLIN